MKNITMNSLADAIKGKIVLPSGEELPPPEEATGLVTDNRNVKPGNIFVALKGERVDGHDFIRDAFAAGALFAISQLPLDTPAGPYILVKDTYEALRKAAAFYRSQLSIPIVGIIGSVGKTSTKEMTAAVLSKKFNVLKTEGNFNNDIGLPLTLCRITEEHEAAVVEMGISDFGEMHVLGEIARPNIAVMTNIGECHLEQLGDLDGVFKAKSEIFEHMGDDPRLVLNTDDSRLAAVKPEDVHGARIITYGLHSQEITAKDVLPRDIDGIDATIVTPGGEFGAAIPIPGEHSVYNALAATAVGLSLDIGLDDIAAGISSVKVIRGRSRFIELNNNITLIDDCYNANPMSMRASLKVLAKADGRKIAVLGDMGELGKDEKDIHYKLGEFAANVGIDHLFTAGALAKYIADGAESAGTELCIHKYDTRDAMLVALVRFLDPGDTILLKASHFMKFDMAVDTIVTNIGE